MKRSAGICGFAVVLALTALFRSPTADAQKKPKSYRLPSVDLKQQVIWGATCDGPDGTGLAFGGEDQKADDGRPHTRIKVNGEWKDIHEELRKNNPLQKYHDRLLELTRKWKAVGAQTRSLHFCGLNHKEQAKRFGEQAANIQKILDELGTVVEGLSKARKGLKGYDSAQAENALKLASNFDTVLRPGVLLQALIEGPAATCQAISFCGCSIEGITASLGAEPPARALSPLVFDSKNKLFVLFGGDHLDYLTNDTWIFDPAKKKWMQRHHKSAPPPRANHSLKAAGDGKIILAGGYTYTSSTDYCGGQYRDLDDGEWTYDIAKDTWTGKEKGVPSNTRVYRTGPFVPEFFLKDPKPDATAFQKQLADLPVNTWVSTKPPHLPQLNRDWGTAVLDPDRDLILRFSGGHSAHGGSDVLHFHLASNRWELPFPVEFPLGQLYTNTEYPEGFNFNRRPWITGHTYQNYGYDPVFKKMLFTGQRENCFIYDPEVADWTGRFAKPKGMVYNSCFYTLTTCPTPQGLVCWTAQGGVFQFDSSKKEWVERKPSGDKLPGSVVDNSTMVYDSKRDRLLFVRKGYDGKKKYDGRIYALDRKTGTVGTLSPKGMETAAAIPWLCQLRYDSVNDLLLVGGTLPPGEDGVRRTPAYDCASNAWVSLKLGGDDPSGKEGRNVSLGLMYDAKRKLFWAVDARSNVFVLRLDPKNAAMRPLR